MRRLILILLATIGSLQFAAAQSSSLNAFSPYTMYGIGDLSIGGAMPNRLMGGIGIATSDPYTFNYQNPASLSSIPRNSAIFSIGAAMSNYYSKMGGNSTSFNSVDLQDVGFAIPLYRGIGLGFSLTPLSAIGYRSVIVNNNPSIIENIGRSVYSYNGEGGVSQLSMHFGMKVVAGLSLGASLNYNFGSIDRFYNTEIFTFFEQGDYRAIKSVEHMNVSKLSYSLGLQYKFRVGATHSITVGATVTPKIRTESNKIELSTSVAETQTDTIFYNASRFSMNVPTKFGGGIYYSDAHLGIGFDYNYQDWSGAFAVPERILLGVQQDFRFGAQYTPDRFNIRSALARWTYKVGARYGQSYLMYDNVKLNDWAVTFGADIPLKVRNFSKVSVGFEVGQRGTLNQGQALDTYFKVCVGITLFGDDMWFVKRKFN